MTAEIDREYEEWIKSLPVNHVAWHDYRNSAAKAAYHAGHASGLAKGAAEVRELTAKLEDATRAGAAWKREADQFARAWQRELKHEIAGKHHLIDALVLGTQRLVVKVPKPCCGQPEYCSDEGCHTMLRYQRDYYCDALKGRQP